MNEDDVEGDRLDRTFKQNFYLQEKMRPFCLFLCVWTSSGWLLQGICGRLAGCSSRGNFVGAVSAVLAVDSVKKKFEDGRLSAEEEPKSSLFAANKRGRVRVEKKGVGGRGLSDGAEERES
jgi:hypothetical protein